MIVATIYLQTADLATLHLQLPMHLAHLLPEVIMVNMLLMYHEV